MQLECVPRERPPRAPRRAGGRAPTAGRHHNTLGGTFGVDLDDCGGLYDGQPQAKLRSKSLAPHAVFLSP